MKLTNVFKPFAPRNLGKVVDVEPKTPAAAPASAVDVNAEYIKTLEARLALQCNLTLSLIPVTRNLLDIANIHCKGIDIELTRLAAIGPILTNAADESRKALAQVKR